MKFKMKLEVQVLALAILLSGLSACSSSVAPVAAVTAGGATSGIPAVSAKCGNQACVK